MSEDKAVKLPEEFESDPWTAGFICELYELFGMPVTGENCISKSEKIKFLWATIGISNALSAEEPMWRAMRGRVDPEKAAEEFARRYYNIRNKMVIEDAPTFLSRIPKAEPSARALPSPKDSEK